jgi:demethylmenaquinone methyltransferase / 2-methoxy-6-polyprenyl-1,4-benzoquinol methylase
VTTSMTEPRAGSGAMFDAIAGRYDLVNRILSLGIDQRWRNLTARALALPEAARVLDVATGTADLAIRIAGLGPGIRVVGLDPSERMLELGRQKIARAGLNDRVELTNGDAEQLPFESASFDGASIAFGIRNVPDRLAALREMARVVKPGHRVAVLELGEPRSGVLGPLARFHVHSVVPAVGALLSGRREYRYLQQSIAAFPPPDQFAELMREAGLDELEITPLTFGVCQLFVGRSRARP